MALSEQHVPALLGGDEAWPEGVLASRFGILARGERVEKGIKRVLRGGADPFGVVIDELHSAVTATIAGQPVLLFGTNSYLGLNFHPQCIAAAVAATERLGTGSTASRVAGGTTRDHVALEDELRAFYARRHATVFNTGFMANLGVVSALVSRGDAVFLDAHCHASIVDAAKLSGAHVDTFAHNSVEDLERLFRGSRIDPARTLVVVEGLYSVHGDPAALAELLALAKGKGAVTLVDEAHALGVYGPRGRGMCELMGVDDLADIVVGTFSKSVGVIGGFCVTDLNCLRNLRIMARPYLYSASLPPAVVAAARRSLQLIAAEPDRRERLWANTRHLRAGLRALGIALSGDGPIGSIAVDRQDGFALWQGALSNGVYVNLLIPPATPNDECALRLSVSAAHTTEQIDEAARVLGKVLAASR